MGLPVFRFTLTHANLGSMQINEPDGWKDAKLKLERHPDFHSLVEYFEGSFIFYGEDNIHNGGADFIRQCENLYGLDAEITILIETTFDDQNYETIFEGQLDLTGLQEVQDNKIEVPIIPTDFWTKMIVRKDTTVNLRSTTDLDGNSIPVVDLVDLNLTSQKVRQVYSAENGQGNSSSNIIERWDIPGNQFGIIDFPTTLKDEIDEKFSYPVTDSPTIPFELFTVKYGGPYQIDFKMCVWSIIELSTVSASIQFEFKINNGTAVVMSRSDLGTPAVDARTEFTLNTTISLQPGDKLRFYIRNTSGGTITVTQPKRDIFRSHLVITADTEYQSSTAQSYLVHDALQSVLDRIIGQYGTLKSEFFGSTVTNGRTYDTDGCGWKFTLLKGLHIRGYTFDEKVFSATLMHLWKCLDPLFNLSLGYEDENGSLVIRIEEKEYQYDASSYSIVVSNVREISREYDHSKIYNRIIAGFNKWQTEETVGSDDVQTKREYTNVIKKIDNALKIVSEAVAGGITIENTRRQIIEQGKDYRFDDDTFIININGDDVSPDRYTPQTNENFNSITSLLNSNTRYNSILTPLRSVLRWGNVWNASLQKYQSSSLKFAAGEGNYDMASDYNCATGDQCIAVICDLLSEKQDIPLGAPSNYGGVFGYLHYPMLYTVDIINFSWDDYVAIRDNRRKCIAVSQTLDNYKRFFIKELIYEICHAKCKIIMWPFDEAPIVIVETTQPVIDYDPEEEEDCGDRVRLLEDGEERITEDGECRNLEDGGTIFLYNESESIEQYFYNDSEVPPADEQYFYNASEL